MIDIRVFLLLVRQNDIESIALAAGFVSATVGRLHDAWATAGQGGKSSFCKLGAGRPGELVVRMPLFEARRTEHRYRRSNLVKGPKSTLEFSVDAPETRTLFLWRAGRGKKFSFMTAGSSNRKLIAGQTDFAPTRLPA